MLKLEKFDGIKTYMFPNSEVATPEIIRAKFPAVDSFVHVIEVNGDVCQAVMNLAALRAIHEIASGLSETEAIFAIEARINAPAEVIIEPEERLAAAAEFQNILALPDTVEVTEMNKTIIQKNIKAGLWGKAHLDVLVKKGLLKQQHVGELI